MSKQVIVITGQTGTGKTSLALKLARERNGELVSVDSRQIYKYLDIITGKDVSDASSFMPSAQSKVERLHDPTGKFDVGYYIINGIKLWLYDVVDPKEYFSSYDFKKLAKKVIDNIQKRDKLPILVGGTYLYLKHLLYGFETENIPPDWKLRKKLGKQSVTALHDMLRSTNEQMFKHLNQSDRNNPQRLIRKIEIAKFVNNPMFQYKPTPGVDWLQRSGDMTFIGLRFGSSQHLEANIKKRVVKRLELGAFDEVKSLLKKGFKNQDPGLKTIGYVQLIDYLEGRKSKEKAIQDWITAEIQYAKRQYTFMKKDRNIVWQEV